MTTANDEKIKNINHALKHLTENHIHLPDNYGRSWYNGEKSAFIRRHLKAIAYLRGLLAEVTGPVPEKKETL